LKAHLSRSTVAIAVVLTTTLGLTTAASAKTPKPATARFTVTDTQRTVHEPATDTTITLPVEISKRAPRGGAVVSYTIGEGNATAGSDFSPASGVVSIPSGKKNGTLRLTVKPDTAFEGAEAFTVRLRSGTGGMIPGTPSTVTYTIIDDEVPSNVFNVTDCVATEQPPARGFASWTPLAGAISYRVEMYLGTTLIGTAETDASTSTVSFLLNRSSLNPTVHVTVFAQTASGTQVAERNCLAITD
jgi:hypothetical protein